MSIFYNLYNIIATALFPLSSTEQEVSSFTPEQAYETLPRAPTFDGNVLQLPDTYSIFAYKDERVAKLIWNIKYKKSKKSTQIGGYALYKELSTNPVRTTNSKKPIIVPVPITKRRKRERGYNQCELLIDELERLDTDNEFTVCKDLLERIQHTSRQTLKGRADRLESAKGVFNINTAVSVKIPNTSKIIVIDDVITTGSTMKEALDTLRSVGFENVSGLSLAH